MTATSNLLHAECGNAKYGFLVTCGIKSVGDEPVFNIIMFERS